MIYRGLLLFFILEYIRPGSYLPVLNLLHLNALVPLLVIAGTLISKESVSHQEVFRDTNARVLVAFMCLLFGSILTAQVTLYAVQVFQTVFGYVLIYWVIFRQVTTVQRIKGVFAVIVLIHLVLAALTPQMFTDPDGRHALASGTFLGDGNDYALSVNVAVPFCLFLMLEARNWLYKAAYGGMLLILVLCIVATKSRGGTVALICVAFYYWLRSDRKILLGSLTAAALSMVLVLAPPSYFARMNTISTHEDGSAQGRLAAWGIAVKMAFDHPLVGVGAGQFASEFSTAYRPVDGGVITAHSIYFLILGELGFPGLALLLFFIAANLFANFRVFALIRDRSPTDTRLLACLSASMIAYSTGGAFLSALYYPHMFILAGLLSAARRLVREGDVAAPAPAAVTAVPRVRVMQPGISGTRVVTIANRRIDR